MAPKAARVWTATAPTRDFREAKWKESAATVADNTILVTAERPKEGFKEFFVEMEYEIDGIKYNLSTQLRVLETAKCPSCPPPARPRRRAPLSWGWR